MYNVFQEENKPSSAVIINEQCETPEELTEILQTPSLPVIFVYNDETDEYSHLDGRYNLDECVGIVNNHLNR